MRPFVLLVCLACLAPRLAACPELSGELVQGGLAWGQVAPGTDVAVDGEAIDVAPDGFF
jgi:hypothetical protein